MKLSSAMVTAVVGAALLLQACGSGRERHGFRGGMGGPPPMAAAGQSREVQLRRFDANADGTITKEEFEKVLQTDFATADTSHDGSLSKAETSAVNQRLLTVREISPIIDWNADDIVSFIEFGAQWQTMFQRADANSDGVVTAEELSRPSSDAPRGGPMSGPGGDRGGRGGPPGGGRPSGGS